ncbi:hypothetical protein ACWGID_37865 [Kribbella sp. NPDC054772]
MAKRTVKAPERSRWYRDGTILTWIGIALAILVALFGDNLWSRLTGLFDREPSLQHRVEQAIAECRQDGYECRTTKSIVIANGAGALTAVGVDLIDKNLSGSAAGSAVLVFDASGGLRWTSPIQSFQPGYGLTGLDTDVTNHLFVSFAVTNHSGIAWVIDPSTTPVQTFGSVGGSGLVIDGYEEPTFAGVRRLHTYREGWPANTRNPSTSRDVFEWNGSRYVHRGCELVGPIEADGNRQVQAMRPAGSARCRQPVGKYSVDLDGDRAAGAQVP